MPTTTARDLPESNMEHCPVCGFDDCAAFHAGVECTGAEVCTTCRGTTCASARLGLDCDADGDADTARRNLYALKMWA